jgi:two-component system, cell cycle sensor histidine kinase and response regulator CckA
MEKNNKNIKLGEEAEERYRLLYIASRDAIMTLEPPDWRFTSGNPAALAMFNIQDEKEFASLGPSDFSPEKQPDGQLSSVKAKEMIGQAMETGSNFFEWTHKRYRGESFPATVLLSRVELGGKKFLQATVRDITKEKQIADKLAESEEKFKNAFDNSMLGMALVSSQGKWLQVNPAVCKMLGFSEQELLAKGFKDITHPDEADRDLGAMKKLLAGEMASYQVEKRYINKGGQTLWVSLHTTLVRDKNKQPLYFVTEIENIDKRKKDQDTLEKLNQMMVGRELEMIKLKKEIAELKKP